MRDPSTNLKPGAWHWMCLLTLSFQAWMCQGHLNRSNCNDLWVHHKVRTSGTYQIDVDGDGPLRPIWVDCEMGDGRELFQVLTVVHHDLEETLQVRGKEPPGSYSRNVTYGDATERHLTTLIDSMFSCQQLVRWDCKGAMFGFWYPPGLDSWWVGRDWRDQFYWGGAETDSRSCGCHPHCLRTRRNSTCNCDANVKQVWLEDAGLLLDARRLPVLQLRFGDTGEANEAGKHTLGPLVCRATGHVDVFRGSFVAPVTITSSGYPSSYPPPFHRYLWTVSVEPGDVMELVFLEYDVLHWGAYAAVPGCRAAVRASAWRHSDGARFAIERQGDAPPYLVTDGSRTLVNLTLTTCNQVLKKQLTKRGFMAEFRRAECAGCEAGLGVNGSQTICSAPCGIISSYGYPYPLVSYEPSGHYRHTWLLRVSPGRVVRLQFNDFDVAPSPGARTCNTDWGLVSIYSGDNVSDTWSLVGSYCNLNRQGVVFSETNVMSVVFHDRFRKIGNSRGFHATYKEFLPALVPKTGNSSRLVNVARGKPAQQNTTHEHYEAQLAVDGNEEPSISAGSCVSTQFIQDPWWQVNLQKEHLVHAVEIHNIADAGPPESPSAWPPGAYALPMPVSGCPSASGFTWHTGCRFHDIFYDVVEDDKIRHWSDGMKLEGGLQEGGGVKQCFCVKKEDAPPSSNATSWPPGNYCILQVGDTCPEGFPSGGGGHVTWIDRRPSDPEARNRAEGFLPRGRYTAHNTTLYFCCRADGSVDAAVRLPTDLPFYLLQYDGGACQKVQGMSVFEQSFHFMEDELGARMTAEADLHGGVPKFREGHPRVDSTLFDRGLVLYYCYYDVDRPAEPHARHRRDTARYEHARQEWLHYGLPADLQQRQHLLDVGGTARGPPKGVRVPAVRAVHIQRRPGRALQPAAQHRRALRQAAGAALEAGSLPAPRAGRLPVAGELRRGAGGPRGLDSIAQPPVLLRPGQGCWWKILPPAGKHVWLSFVIFDLARREAPSRAGQCQDQLLLCPGRDPKSNCSDSILSPNGQTFPKEIISNGPMEIHLKTCFRYSLSRFSGFYATYKFTDCPGCGMGDYHCAAVHVCDAHCGHVFSIDYPKPYVNNHRCAWLIVAPPSHYINVTFEDFDLPSAEHCASDYLEFYDGRDQEQENLIGRYCNNSMPPRNVVSSWNTLSIVFSTDGKGTGRGLALSYQSLSFQLPADLNQLYFDNPQECPQQWKFYNDHCYNMYEEPDPLQWYEAEAKCAAWGKGRSGHLVSILDEREMAIIHYFLTDIWKAHRKSLYIGLTDAAGEGFYRWSDGNPMSYSDWAYAGHGLSSQPDWVAYEDCTMLRVDSGHSTAHWHDIPCSLGKHSLGTLNRAAEALAGWRQMEELPITTISAYICKMSSHKADNAPGPPPLYRHMKAHVGEVRVAPEKYFVCRNKEVISVVNVCDGVHDCRDRSDESGCGVTCPDGSFRCASGKCVSIGAFCDFKDDCGDSSDESQCDYIECNRTEFRCKNGQCISIAHRCDLLSDCHDNSDEQDCLGQCNVNVTFQCYDGTCIPKNAVCDGHRDCPGKYHEDEQDGCHLIKEEDRQGLEEEKKKCDNKRRHPAQRPLPDRRGRRRGPDLAVPRALHHGIDGGGRAHAGAPRLRAEDLRPLGCRGRLRAAHHLRSRLGADARAHRGVPEVPTVRQVGVQRRGRGLRLLGRAAPVVVGERGRRPAVLLGRRIGEPHVRLLPGLLQPRPALQLRLELRVPLAGGPRLHRQQGDAARQKAPFRQHVQNWSSRLPYHRSSGMLQASNIDGGMRFLAELLAVSDRSFCQHQHQVPVRVRPVRLPGGLPGRVPSPWMRARGLSGGLRQVREVILHSVALPVRRKVGLYWRRRRNRMQQVYVPGPLQVPQPEFVRGPAPAVRRNPPVQARGRRAPLRILQYNGLTVLPSNKFIELKNLYLLDLRNNRIVQIETAAFAGLKNVRFLHLENNPILSEIKAGAFVGLNKLTFLNLSGMALSGLKRNTFVGLDQVTTLNLRNNKLQYVEDGAFQGLKSVTSLDIQGNDIQHFSHEMFHGLHSLESLFSDSFKFCCLASPQVSFDYCLPPADEISSCEDLMSSPVQRSFLWVLGVVALLGNLFVIAWRLKTKNSNPVSSTLILSLGCADLLMGVYLIVIASVDIYYRGRYIQNSDVWRASALCKLCGFLSTLSSESSIFTLVLITADRLICISFPFSVLRFGLRRTYQLIAAAWATAAAIAALPLVVQPYFQGEFYARSGVCLALHITSQKPSGWEYSVAVFFCANFFAFASIVAAYAYMYLSIRRSKTAVKRHTARQAADSLVGRQMALIVFTNSLCWFPMIVMGLMAMSGVRIPGEAYAWTAVFVLPANSAANPLIYTIASLRFRLFLLRVGLARKKHSLSFSKAIAHASNGGAPRRDRGAHTFRPPHGYVPLMQLLRSEPRVTPHQLLQVAVGVSEVLCELHAQNYALGGINVDCVFVALENPSKLHVYLPDINAYRIDSNSYNTNDTAADMEEFGGLVKKMLRAYHVSQRARESSIQ
nr:uncharacterized protein LOC126532264 isoform X4 [Dermacentor andersoni]